MVAKKDLRLTNSWVGEVDAEHQRESWISRYEQGLAKYRNRDFSGAILDFKAVLGDRRRDRPSEIMLARCEQLRQGTNEEWRPIAALKSK